MSLAEESARIVERQYQVSARILPIEVLTEAMNEHDAYGTFVQSLNDDEFDALLDMVEHPGSSHTRTPGEYAIAVENGLYHLEREIIGDPGGYILAKRIGFSCLNLFRTLVPDEGILTQRLRVGVKPDSNGRHIEVAKTERLNSLPSQEICDIPNEDYHVARVAIGYLPEVTKMYDGLLAIQDDQQLANKLIEKSDLA